MSVDITSSPLLYSSYQTTPLHHANLCAMHMSETAAVSCDIIKVLIHMQWRFTSKVEDVLDTTLLKAVEAAVKSSLSMKRIKIQGEFIKWTNVATAILKGAAQSTSLMELELETPVEFPPPQEVLGDVRKAKPELRLVVISGGESVLYDITWHYMLLVLMFFVSCPKLCLSGVRWSVGTSVV